MPGSTFDAIEILPVAHSAPQTSVTHQAARAARSRRVAGHIVPISQIAAGDGVREPADAAVRHGDDRIGMEFSTNSVSREIEIEIARPGCR
jgi:hypothetical protein